MTEELKEDIWSVDYIIKKFDILDVKSGEDNSIIMDVYVERIVPVNNIIIDFIATKND